MIIIGKTSNYFFESLRYSLLHKVPDSIGRLVVGKSLRLNSNAIVELPEKFKEMKIGGDLDLRCNHLTEFDSDFFEDMWVHGAIFCEQQEVFDAGLHAATVARVGTYASVYAEFRAAVKARNDTSRWIDPVKGVFILPEPLQAGTNESIAGATANSCYKRS